jgi:hypothetical protein
LSKTLSGKTVKKSSRNSSDNRETEIFRYPTRRTQCVSQGGRNGTPAEQKKVKAAVQTVPSIGKKNK